MIYIGNNNIAKEFSKGYIGIDGLAKNISKIYVGVNGIAQLAWEEVKGPFPWEVSSNGSYYFALTTTANKYQSTNYNKSSTTATTTWTVTIPKEVSYTFQYQVSSETNYDKMSIILDGTTIVNNISGAGSLLSMTKTLSAGTHTITAKYVKDGSVNKNNDRGYIILPPITYN